MIAGRPAKVVLTKRCTCDETMHVPAQQRLDLWVPCQPGRQRRIAAAANPVHTLDADAEGWMVQRQQNRLAQRAGALQPVDLGRGDLTPLLAGNDAVEKQQRSAVEVDPLAA